VRGLWVQRFPLGLELGSLGYEVARSRGGRGVGLQGGLVGDIFHLPLLLPLLLCLVVLSPLYFLVVLIGFPG
jgi:hypothetical protein